MSEGVLARRMTAGSAPAAAAVVLVLAVVSAEIGGGGGGYLARLWADLPHLGLRRGDPSLVRVRLLSRP